MFFSRVTKQSKNLTVLLDLLSKLDASILFVQVFVAFIDFVFVYSSDLTYYYYFYFISLTFMKRKKKKKNNLQSI